MEEAGILWSKRPLAEAIEDEGLSEQRREKLQAVVAARRFAEHWGLTPEGTYREYAEVDRDVLVWVLTAAPKTKLESKTWWFPVVGRLPYKGFFDKADAVEAESELKSLGYDTAIRPSLAYSTLGWFDDPLISSMLSLELVPLVNTVFHEIVHSTLWLDDQTSFNETMAQVLGGLYGVAFFCEESDYAEARTL